MSVQTKVSPDESHSIWYLDGTSSGQTKFVITNVIAMMPLNFFRSTIFLIYFLYLSACLMVLSSNIPKVQMKSWHHQQTVEWNSRDIVIRTGFHLDFIWTSLVLDPEISVLIQFHLSELNFIYLKVSSHQDFIWTLSGFHQDKTSPHWSLGVTPETFRCQSSTIWNFIWTDIWSR